MYYVFSIWTKKIVHKAHSYNVGIHVLETYNKKRGTLGFAMMDEETYIKNYGEPNEEGLCYIQKWGSSETET